MDEQNTSNIAHEFQCEDCDFICRYKRDYDRHIVTAKHILRTSLEQSSTSKTPTTFSCSLCDFMCSKKGDYTRHISSAKHLGKSGSEPDVIPISDTSFPCTKCNRVYACRNSLWYHTKRCAQKKTNRVLQVGAHTFRSETDDTILHLQAMLASQTEAHSEQIAQLIGVQVQSQAQVKLQSDAQAEQIKLLIEAISLQGPHTVTNNNNNTTNNNQFNLNVFLNEDCKDAYTFKEVMESIVCTVDDLDRLIVEGYAATVIRKILESMQDMAITERPIHCTDLRRNTVCVKSATGWEKGEAALKRLNNSLYFIGKKLGNVVPEWRETYPDHFRGTDSRRNQYHTLIVEVLKVDDVKLEDRNVGIICKSLVLDRKTAKAGIM